PSGTSHVLDKPSHTYSQYLTGAGTWSRFGEKWFFYDGLSYTGVVDAHVTAGNVTTVESWLDQSTVQPPACTADTSKRCVGTTMRYDDGYGNLTKVTDARGNPTTTNYDDGHSTFLYPYQITNAASEVTTILTDYRWGEPTSVTASNGLVTLY